MTYPGGKGGAGVYQKLINEIPPHTTYLETHLGGGAILRHKRPAGCQVGIDIDAEVIEAWNRNVPPDTELVCSDAVAFLEGFAFQDSEFVYADPPYVMETRRRGDAIYRHEYTKRQHVELLECLKELPCMVMVSGYWSELYADTLDGWRAFSFEAQTRSGQMATEWAWMNYPECAELHDYRYLGDTFRERERIKRKRKRWVERLKTIPQLERQALLAALTLDPASAEMTIPAGRASPEIAMGSGNTGVARKECTMITGKLARPILPLYDTLR